MCTVDINAAIAAKGSSPAPTGVTPSILAQWCSSGIGGRQNPSNSRNSSFRISSASGVSRDNQDGKRDNQDGKFFEGVIFEPFGSDLTL